MFDVWVYVVFTTKCKWLLSGKPISQSAVFWNISLLSILWASFHKNASCSFSCILLQNKKKSRQEKCSRGYFAFTIKAFRRWHKHCKALTRCLKGLVPGAVSFIIRPPLRTAQAPSTLMCVDIFLWRQFHALKPDTLWVDNERTYVISHTKCWIWCCASRYQLSRLNIFLCLFEYKNAIVKNII